MSGNGVRRVCPPKNASLLGEMVLFSYHDSPGVTLGVPGEFCLENDAKPLDFEGFSVNLQTKPVSIFPEKVVLPTNRCKDHGLPTPHFVECSRLGNPENCQRISAERMGKMLKDR